MKVCFEKKYFPFECVEFSDLAQRRFKIRIMSGYGMSAFKGLAAMGSREQIRTKSGWLFDDKNLEAYVSA
jgi:hypothetical protein